ncbi:MAG: 50S ribosomal protein L29 [Chloroflexi bacterium]|nr:50S ribosomal protein L29 [Chloroflexota bacterium]
MKAEQARGMSDVDLLKEIEGARRELFNLRLRAATKQLADNTQIMKTRRKVALLLTVKKEREQGNTSQAAS